MEQQIKLKKDWKNIFDEDGNWILTGYNPYHHIREISEEDYNNFHNMLFDEDGYTNLDYQELLDLIREQKWGPFCNAVEYFYSIDIPSFTKGNYSSIYLWR